MFRGRRAEPELTDAVREACATARTGRQLETLPVLLDFARSDEPLVSWTAASAAVGILGWTDGWAQAADLGEWCVRRWNGSGHLLDPFEDEDPFATAIEAAEIYAAIPALPRLIGLADAVASDPVLDPVWSRRVTGVAALGRDGPYPRYLIGPLAWSGAEPSPDVRRLDARGRHRLWVAAHSRTRADLALALYDAGDAPPTPYYYWYLLAAALLQTGRQAEAEQIMLWARENWHALFWWQTVPSTLALWQFRYPLITPRVRQEYLTMRLSLGPQ